jgi:hypothetical protein
MTDKKMELLLEENIPAEPTYPAWVMEVGEVDAEAFEKAKALHDRAMADDEFRGAIRYYPNEPLTWCFTWRDTEEGQTYWGEIHSKITEQCK